MTNFHISSERLSDCKRLGGQPLSEILNQAEETLGKGGKFIIQLEIPNEEPVIKKVIDSLEEFEDWKTQFIQQSTEDNS